MALDQNGVASAALESIAGLDCEASYAARLWRGETVRIEEISHRGTRINTD